VQGDQPLDFAGRVRRRAHVRPGVGAFHCTEPVFLIENKLK
jgi:hypothetical protein